ncbi:MAG: hypothetical protein RSC05_14955 [Acinetobacter sp.]
MKNNDVRRIYSEEEAEALRASYRWVAGVLQHEFDQETIDGCQAEIQAGIERIIRGESTEKEEYQSRLNQHVKKLRELSNQNRMQESIKNNPVLGNPNSDILAVNAEVHRLQNEAAKNPDHWINDGLKNHIAEELQKLEQLKKLNLK